MLKNWNILQVNKPFGLKACSKNNYGQKDFPLIDIRSSCSFVTYSADLSYLSLDESRLRDKKDYDFDCKRLFGLYILNVISMVSSSAVKAE